MTSPSEEVPHATDARVVLYSRTGCHLCEQAHAVVESVCAEVGADLVVVDIDADVDQVELRDRFGDQVPVTYVDGRPHDFWRVDPARLRAALDR